MARSKNIRSAVPHDAEPRELTQFQSGLLQEARRKITIRVDGKAEEAELSQVVIRKLFQVAAGGLPNALGHVLRSINDAQKLNQALIRDEVKRGRQIKKSLEKRLARAVQNGADPLWVVPHPDDIVIVEGEGWAVAGPADESDLERVKQHLVMREMLLLQSVLDERLAGVPRQESSATPTEATAGSTSLVLAHMLNQALPARFRMSIPEMTCEIMRYGRLTKRALLKAAHKGWAAIGHRRPRGTALPPWADVEQLIVR